MFQLTGKNRKMSNPNPSPENRFKPGESGNPSGRPKGGLKDYDRKRFQEMSDQEKEEFLSKIAPEIRYRMAEGNPDTNSDITSGGKVIVLPATLIDKNDTIPPIEKNDTTPDTGNSSEG